MRRRILLGGLILGLSIGVTTLRLHARPDRGDGEDNQCRDDNDHSDHDNGTPLKLIGAICIARKTADR